MQRFKHNSAFILVLLGLLGCSDRHGASHSVDSWYHAPKDDIARFWQAAELSNSDVFEVIPGKMIQAEEQLRETSSIVVSSQQASELAGRKVESTAEKSLFLVRGVYLNRGTGKFKVIPLRDELLVHHLSLGHSAVAMKRQALLVQLLRKPKVVFVTCQMAE